MEATSANSLMKHSAADVAITIATIASLGAAAEFAPTALLARSAASRARRSSGLQFV
jgi:hypothetical protein